MKGLIFNMLAGQARKISLDRSIPEGKSNSKKIISSIKSLISRTADAGQRWCQYIAPDETMKFVQPHKIDEYFKGLGYNISHFPRYKSRKFKNWSKALDGPQDQYEGLCFTISW